MLNHGYSVPAAIAAGMLTGIIFLVTAFLIHNLLRLQSSGNLDYRNAIGVVRSDRDQPPGRALETEHSRQHALHFHARRGDGTGVMENAAERLLGLQLTEIKELGKDITFGQMRVVIATMNIEDINSDRDKLIAPIANGRSRTEKKSVCGCKRKQTASCSSGKPRPKD